MVGGSLSQASVGRSQTRRLALPAGAEATLRRLVPLALVLVAAALAATSGQILSHGAPAQTASRSGASHRTGLSDLPLAAQGTVSGALGAGDDAYRVIASAGGLRAHSPAQRLTESFGPSGVKIHSGTTRVGLTLRAVGFGASLRPLAEAAPRARSNRVSYTHAGLREWYANGPLGLEQGFTVLRAPSGDPSAPLTISLALSGNAHAATTAGGQSVVLAHTGGPSLHYTGLSVADARGRPLHGWLALRAGRLLLNVDARGARYPLRIDPLIQQGATFVQQGTKLAGAGVSGFSVAVSADGNTALVGGPLDNGGSAVVFTRSGATWTQQGPKLKAGGGSSGVLFGDGVALSANGNTALIGDPEDSNSSGAGAVWVFTRSGSTWTQQGGKLTPSGESGGALFGDYVAVSADGSTALIGGPNDNSNVGAAWVFTRSGTTWTQQGSKLTGSGGSGEGLFGDVVALSADGGTALIGGPRDNSGVGAAWVFTRSGTTWTQQGSKLTGSDESGAGQLGRSVALSADGNTALIGGDGDNSNTGAAWVFTRSGTAWTQQGSKLTGSGESGAGFFGTGVALTADGNTALIGGSVDNSFVGAAWVFTRSGSTWTQRGEKLTGSGGTGKTAFGESVALSADGNTAVIGGPNDNANNGAVWVFTPKLTGAGESGTGGFGVNVALSADGNTALVGGPNDNSSTGAAWVFVRSGSTWTQQGSKLTGTGESGAGDFGVSVALSSDGNTALIGGYLDNENVGAAWVFVRSGSTWTQQGLKLTGSGETGKGVFAITVALSFDGNTALIGGDLDSEGAGAAWVFTRSGGVWSQQGSKLTGGGEIGKAFLGGNVALSADGNTALIGGSGDNGSAGSTWVFTRSGSTWSQQGEKLTGSGESGKGTFGISVDLSSDGNTALIGADKDSEGVGAAWAFTRSGTTWTQQGSKLTGAGESGKGEFADRVALSANGNTALIGGASDNSSTGAAWIFTRSGSTRSQQGEKLTGSGEIGAGRFGAGVALSSEADTALIGGNFDNANVGGVWAFVSPPTVTKVKPSSGPVSGGTTVTITGTNLTGAWAVAFGSRGATSFSVTSPTSITAVAPPEPAGTTDVTVGTYGGISALSTKDRFKFTPTITGVSPNKGSTAGGTTVTVTGTGFAIGKTATVLKFGTTKGTAVNCGSTTSCTVTSPAHVAGTVDVRATVNKVTSPKAVADQFSYS